MVKKIILALSFLACLVNFSYGQTDFKQYYFNGKNLYKEKKYNLAMESFRSAIQYDKTNPYAEYASFYYAMSAYNQGYRSVAKDMLNQIKSLYPSWDKIEEVNFWLGKIQMEDRDYFQGLKIWNGIKDKNIQKDISFSKISYLAKINDPETLRMMNEEYPTDKEIGKALTRELAKNLTDSQSRDEFEKILKQHNLDRKDFLNETPATYFRDTYSVSVMYPFMVKSLEASTNKKKNQLILDLYEGMKLAVDTLKKQGVSISLRAYDTERKVSTINKLLETEELKNTDLIVGPFFPEENKVVQDFSAKNRINMIKPFTSNLDMVKGNDYGFLFQPSYETIGARSAEFLGKYMEKRKKTCMVFGGITHKDSLMVGSFLKKAKEVGLEVINVKLLPKDDTKDIINILATSTEKDEWNNPVEFTLKKGTVGCIFVPSDDALIYSKVISSVETRKDSIVVLGMESWLEQNALDIEKYHNLHIVLASPNFTSGSNPYFKMFLKKYLSTHGEYPSGYAKMGYEMMLFIGNALNKSGVYFQETFNKDEFIKGYLSEGYNFQFSHDNQVVPFVKFNNGELKVIKQK